MRNGLPVANVADKCSCAWLGQRVAGLHMLTLLPPGQAVTLHL